MNFGTRTANSIFKKKLSQNQQQLRRLNLQEYQSKQLLRQNGCTVQNFFIIDENRRDIDTQFRRSVYDEYVVKAQILAGGRGKGHFLGGLKNKGGVYITKSINEARSSANEMLGKRLVTNQTKPEGVLVKKVMVAESVPIKRETYLSILMDPTSIGPVIMACPVGGMDIEEIAAKHPDLILKEPISVSKGITNEQCQRIADFLQFSGKPLNHAAEQIRKLFEFFVKVDATQIEINPLAEINDGRVFCIDAKLNFDDCASFRQKEIFDLDTFEEMDSREIRAKKFGLNYIGLNGSIACLVNGAGLAMATMDIIKLHGGEPANFLDVGGSASTEQVKEAFKIITSDRDQLSAIFVNIFGGIMRCDVIAQGILDACSELELSDLPVVIRLKGTRVAEAKKLLENASHLGTFELCDSFESAAQRVVHLANMDRTYSTRIQQQEENFARARV